MDKISAIILAAGQGTRMKSKKPKILHHIAGKPMINCIMDQLKGFAMDKIVIVVGSPDAIPRYRDKRVRFVLQKEKRGTAHAVMQAEKELGNYPGDVFVLNGDVPLITFETLENLLKQHRNTFACLSLLTARLPNPTGYGRIIRKQGEISKIVEELDADDHIKPISEINTGTYCFKGRFLFSTLRKIKKNPIKGEYYITDAVDILNQQGSKVHTCLVKDNEEIIGVNKRNELAMANKIMQKRIHRKLLESGVTIIDVDSTYIEYDVLIGQDTVIYPFTFLYGSVTVGENGQLGPFIQITNSRIGNNARIYQSTISDSRAGNDVHIGPYAHVRDHTVLRDGSKIGNFVEITRSRMGEKSRAFHLSYIGDAEIGRNVNFGANIVTANYDGRRKNRTVIEDGSFIGSSTTIIAPRRIRKKARIPAGTILKG